MRKMVTIFGGMLLFLLTLPLFKFVFKAVSNESKPDITSSIFELYTDNRSFEVDDIIYVGDLSSQNFGATDLLFVEESKMAAIESNTNVCAYKKARVNLVCKGIFFGEEEVNISTQVDQYSPLDYTKEFSYYKKHFKKAIETIENNHKQK